MDTGRLVGNKCRQITFTYTANTYCLTDRLIHNWAFNCLLQSILVSKKKKCGSRALGIVQNRTQGGGNGSNAAQMTARNSLLRIESPGHQVYHAWCMIPEKQYLSELCNLQSIFSRRRSAFTNDTTPYVIIVVLSGQTLGNSRIDTSTEKPFTTCAIFPQAQPRSVG